MGKFNKAKHGGAAKVKRGSKALASSQPSLTLAERATKGASSAKAFVPVKLNTKNGRRVAKHKMFQAKVNDNLKKRAEEKRGETVFNVLSLTGSLLEAQAEATTPKKAAAPMKPARRNKAKKAIGNREVAQMQAVMMHGAFQANPLGTIKQHLQNTIRPPAAP